MEGDPLDREMQRTAERHRQRELDKSLRLSFLDFVWFAIEAIGALAPLAIGIYTGHVKLGVLIVIVLLVAIVLGWFSIVRFTRKLRRRTNGSR